MTSSGGATAGQAHRTVRLACGLSPNDRLVVCLAGADLVQGLATLIAALPRLPRHHVALVGDLPPGDDLLDRADRLGVRGRVHVVPAPPGDLAAFLGSAELGLVGYERGTGAPVTAAIQAYRAAGLTVLAAEAGPARGFLTDNDLGVLFRAGDPAGGVRAVRQAVRERSRSFQAARWVVGRPRRVAGALKRAVRRRSLLPAPRPAAPPTPAPPTWRPLGDTPIRLGLGTANHAGQLSAFAWAICRNRPDVSAELVVAQAPGRFRHPADEHLTFQQQRLLSVQLAQAERVFGYTHLLADAFRPVLGYLNGNHIDADLPTLRRVPGLKVALLGHGSEVRHPARHRERHGHSMFLDAPPGIEAQLTTLAERSQRVARDSGLPVFVTTLDLLSDLPQATWAPLVLDVDVWASDRPPLERARPVVLHAPSNRWTKGTDRILPVLTELHDRGAIDFRLVEGMPWSEMRDLVRDADIVVDQLVMGSYCAFAVEGMAAGRPVVAFLDEQVHRAAGVAPPIVNATPATLRTAIESLLDDRARGAELGARSVEYVREHHDGRRTAAAFGDFLT
ncbi:glycosyl transferase family 1 [Catellatospora chokoriensis]|uniref:Uncharacterized protein n=1 Tax=Catellatospora chokoriensis TaxID=310353 RepID=A0A8J3K290_9ACTN|nr:glycosyl transferase family 1 [Catellatospora chokoriensis]GIF89088.1 hypothetical protein Cch02nite_25320 [Catellatospora chokoriensis]